MSSVRIALLGHPLIEREGVPLHVDTRKAVALLAYLLVREWPQSRDALASLLWPEYDESSARAALRRTLSTLRAAVGPDAVRSDRSTISISRHAMDVDLDRFRAHLAEARSHEHDIRQACARCLPLLAEAAALARGDFLEGFSLRDAPDFDDWQMLEAQAVRQELAQVLEGASAGFTQRGELERAIEHARRWLELDTLHEPAHRTLMRLYTAAGRQSAALHQYRECVRILQEELAVAPAEETTSLYRSILEREDSPVAPAVAPPARYEPPGRELPLVGRAAEWQRLVRACDAIFMHGYAVALEGEGGIGKTRLLSEMLALARDRGATTVATRCYEGETEVAYAPVVQLLRGTLQMVQPDDVSHLTEVARLLPELAGQSPSAENSPVDSPGAQTRFLDGLVRTLLAPAERGPLILAVDDLQWADASSVGCLLYLLHRLGDLPVGLVLTWRSDELPQAHIVRRAVTDAERRGRGLLVHLGRLDRRAVQELVEAVVPEREGRDLGARLFEETEGLPLFLDEYLTLMLSGSQPETLPQGAREMLESRLAAISETGGQFLAVAAVIGRSFDFDTLREASGRDEEMAIAALEELTSQGLVRETADTGALVPAYDFSHDKLRALVYERTSLPRRRLLHRRVAETLVARSRRVGSGALAGTIAHHYQAAGLLSEAASYHGIAGEHARGLYANREAMAHFEAALALGHGDSGALQEALGDLHALLGEFRAAATMYEAAASLSEGETLARIDRKLGNVHDRWGEWELADAYYEEAMRALSKGDRAEQARIYADRAMTAHHRGDEDTAGELAGTALALARDGNDALALARVHNLLGILEAGQDQLARAADQLERSLSFAEEVDEPTARIAALHNLSLVELRRGDLEGARTLAQRALVQSAAQGDRHREAALHNTLADVFHAGGDGDRAIEHLKQAVSIYAEIGVDADGLRPEVWKLTEW